MMDNSVENRLYRLETRAEVENIIGTYCHLLFAGEGGQIMDELWSRSEEVSIEIGASGRYSTREKVATYYQKDHIAGKFTLLLPVTPVIETAADGRSARGMWFVLGWTPTRVIWAQETRKKEHFSPQRQRMERHIGRNAPSGVWGRTLSGKGNSGGFFIFISTIWCVFHAVATGFVLPRSAMRRMEYGWTPCSGPISRLQKTVLRKIWPIRRLPITGSTAWTEERRRNRRCRSRMRHTQRRTGIKKRKRKAWYCIT